MIRELGATKTIVSFTILSAILLVNLTSSATAQLDTSELSRNKEFSNAIMNAIAGSPSLLSNDKKVADAAEPANTGLTPQEANTISVIMQTMMPSMFGLFSNITDPAYKAKFKDPCRFDVLMDLFKNLPPYFDVIASKYPNKNDLIAYYSMQLASTFLVNNGSLTMACMYNMLSLQTTLFDFSLDLMDNPEKKPELVGLFGIFMKPVMSMLKKNSMMKIIEHVDRYDKNDNESTIPLFHFLNFVYVFLGIFAILSNILLVLLLRRSQTSHFTQFQKQQPIAMNANTLTRKGTSSQTDTLLKSQKKTNLDCANVAATGTLKSSSTTAIIHKNKRRSRRSKSSTQSSSSSKYRRIKSNNSRMFWMIRKKYKTRFCFMVIAVCHSFYILVNFMIMSQAGLAAAALKGLSQYNFMCKLAFFMSPPTTVFNIAHQLAIWLLVYVVKQHSAKLRRTRASTPDLYSYEIDYIENHAKFESDLEEKELTESSGSDNDEDTVSVSLTNNSNNLILMSQSGGLVASTVTPSTTTNQQVKFITPDIAPSSLTVSYNPILNHQRHPFIHYPPPVSQLHSSTLTKSKSKHKQAIPLISNDTLLPLTKQHNKESKLTKFFCFLFSHKQKNLLFCILLYVFISIYDSQNFFLYSLSELKKDDKTIYFCAFNSDYSEYYTILNQYILPAANLFLFSFFPLALCTMQVLFDFCFLVRVKREQMKRYERIKDVIEWPVYGYYCMYMLSQLPLGIHQLVDLAKGKIKFPFVFPLFIQLKFTSMVWLNVLEMSLMFVCYSSDLYIWMLADKDIRRLAAYWLNKRIFCRTYKQNNNSKSNKCPTNRCGNSSSSGNIDGSCSVASCQSSSENFSSNRSDSSAGDVIRENEMVKKENAKRIYKKTKSENKKATDIDLQIAQKMNSSSTASSSSSASSSSNLHKKQISPIIASAADHVAATAKATAAISASVSKQATFDTELTSTSKQQIAKNSIKMIDTDNDEIDDILDIEAPVEAKLTKLNEDKELDSSTLTRAYADKPPSFNTATRSKPDRRQHHQYQNNVDFTQIHQID